MEQGTVLDLEVVGPLRALDADGNLFSRLIEAFRGDVRRLSAEVSAGVRGLEAEQVCRAAHGLQGAAGSLGLVGLSRLCVQLEALGQARRFELAGATLALFELRVEEALGVLEAFGRAPP